MTQTKVDLSLFDPSDYNHGASKFKYFLWHLVNTLIFRNGLFASSRLRVSILRAFGAKIGKGVEMNKPNINIKYPWKLSIGNYSWIGENSWIYNMDEIVIGDNVNVSQGVFLLTGNHNYKSKRFEVFTKPIYIKEGVFLGANSVVCPGVICHQFSVLTVNSVATKDLESFGIYTGNPAVKVKDR